jgi:LPS export ABC transporter permease LptG
MKILSRYVLREYLQPFLYCFVTFYGLYVLSTLFGTLSKMTQAHTPLTLAAHYFFAYMSPYVVWLFPASLMLAALYTMWNFCHHSEIIAMRANGLSYATVVMPIMAVAVAISLLCALNQEFYAPGGREFARRVEAANFHKIHADIRPVPFHNYTAHRVWQISRINFENPRVLEGVCITTEDATGRKIQEISCKRAEFLDGVWWLYYPQYHAFDASGNRVDPPPSPLLNLSLRAMPQFDEKPVDFVTEVKDWEYLSLREMVAYMHAHPRMAHKDRLSRLCDIHNRIAMPWACIVITLFAIPAGVATGRQSVFKGILLAIGLFFGFYAAVGGCTLLAKFEWLPPWLGAWLPNLAFLGAGITLFARLR